LEGNWNEEERKEMITVAFSNGHAYSMSEGRANACIKMAREKFVKSNTNAIVATRIGNIIEMKKDTFVNCTALDKCLKEFKKAKIVVHYVRVEVDLVDGKPQYTVEEA
jgi:hypothetical protein